MEILQCINQLASKVVVKDTKVINGIVYLTKNTLQDEFVIMVGAYLHKHHRSPIFLYNP